MRLSRPTVAGVLRLDSTSDFGNSPYTLAATLDTGSLARSYSSGVLTGLSSNDFQGVRSPHGYPPATATTTAAVAKVIGLTHSHVGYSTYFGTKFFPSAEQMSSLGFADDSRAMPCSVRRAPSITIVSVVRS